MYRLFIYSLRDVNGKSVLSIDLGGKIISNNLETFQIELTTGTHTLRIKDWLNNDRIFDDGKVSFLVCSKNRDRVHVFKVLMKYAIGKLKTRRENIDAYIQKFEKELVAA